VPAALGRSFTLAWYFPGATRVIVTPKAAMPG
jgi:hypothetical protein